MKTYDKIKTYTNLIRVIDNQLELIKYIVDRIYKGCDGSDAGSILSTMKYVQNISYITENEEIRELLTDSTGILTLLNVKILLKEYISIVDPKRRKTIRDNLIIAGLIIKDFRNDIKSELRKTVDSF